MFLMMSVERHPYWFNLEAGKMEGHLITACLWKKKPTNRKRSNYYRNRLSVARGVFSTQVLDGNGLCGRRLTLGNIPTHTGAVHKQTCTLCCGGQTATLVLWGSPAAKRHEGRPDVRLSRSWRLCVAPVKKLKSGRRIRLMEMHLEKKIDAIWNTKC